MSSNVGRVDVPDERLHAAQVPAVPGVPRDLRDGYPERDRGIEDPGAVQMQGTASMQERRWFYRASERYAPFTVAPPADWKLKDALLGKQ